MNSTKVATHTATPWRLSHNDDTTIVKNARIVATVGDLYVPSQRPQSQADAAHIIHCVNSHDALVEALRKCMEALEHYTHQDSYAYKQAEQALAAAGGL